MKKYYAIFMADIKNIRRDPTLLLMFWVPFLIWGVVRFGLPQLNQCLPEIQSYYMPLVLFFSLLIAIFPGFIVSFIILDEKDAQLLAAQKVTPVSLSGFLLVRLGFMVLLGFVFSALFLFLNGLVVFPIYKLAILAFFCALNTPILILLISAFAKNKVEGMTYLKVANLSYAIPLISLFINAAWKYGLAVFPAFWVFIYARNFNYADSLLVFLLGTIILLTENYLSYKLCIKKLQLF